jgi:hypothetical protein
MGGSTYSVNYADNLRARRMAVPAATFKAATFTSTYGIDAKLDPKGVAFRESCDSDTHPESNAIIVFFDVTGSMGGIPIKFAQDKLPGLMKMLLSQNTILHPQVMFGAVGDARSDSAPLQIGQFESGQEMDDWLTKIYLEGGGGGSREESYELAMYWAAKHTKMDCMIKRGKKGYLFLIGDESYYPQVSKDQIKEIIGDDVQSDIPIEDCLEMAQENFEVFRISVASGSYHDGTNGPWKKLMGQRAIYLQDSDLVCEYIAAHIATLEGVDGDNIRKGLTAAGLSSSAYNTIEKSLVPVGAGGGTIAKVGTSSEPLPPTGPGGSTVRL